LANRWENLLGACFDTLWAGRGVVCLEQALKKETKQKKPKKIEYSEGAEAMRAFENAMKVLFRAPKIRSKKGKD
jgi:hypothetical protein